MDVTSLVNLFYNNPTFSDIMMIINEEKVHLHKIILSQSSKFAKAFETGEDHHSKIVLHNYEFADEMKSFLSALYTGTLDLEDVNVQFLLMLSVEYDMPWIESRCAAALDVNTRNAAKYLEIACKVRSEKLEKICIALLDVSLDTIGLYLELGKTLCSSALIGCCAKVLSRYSYLWKLYKSDLWIKSDSNFIAEVLSCETSLFAVPVQSLALISWLEHSSSLESYSPLLRLMQYKYLPHTFLTSFLSPCLYELTKTPLPPYLPDTTVKQFTYFVRTDSPEEQATEKCTGLKNSFYSENLLDLDYREYLIALPLKLLKFTNPTEVCRCSPEDGICVCSSTISACHVTSAGVMVTVNPKMDHPLHIDSGRSTCYWFVMRKGGEGLPWSKLCGVTRGHSKIQLTSEEIIACAADSDSFDFHFFV